MLSIWNTGGSMENTQGLLPQHCWYYCYRFITCLSFPFPLPLCGTPSPILPHSLSHKENVLLCPSWEPRATLSPLFIFIYLAEVLVAAHRIFTWGMWGLIHSLQFTDQGLNPGPALGTLDHWRSPEPFSHTSIMHPCIVSNKASCSPFSCGRYKFLKEWQLAVSPLCAPRPWQQ